MAALYEVLRIWRKAFGGGAVVLFIQDVIFFSLCGLASFLFMLVFNGGTVRIYFFIAHLAGAVIYALTLGRLVDSVSKYIIENAKKLADAVKQKAVYPFFVKIDRLTDRTNSRAKRHFLQIFPVDRAVKRIKNLKIAKKT